MTAIDEEIVDSSELLSCGKVNFEEKKEYMQLLCSLKTFKDASQLESACTKLCGMMDKYQEQPQILDAHLEEIVGVLLTFLKAAVLSDGKTEIDSQFICHSRILYSVSKVRGPKVIVKFLSHEAAELEPLVDTLEIIDKQDYQLWECRYVLLLWLSLVIRIPLDLFRIDSNSGSAETSTIKRVQVLSRSFLSASGKEREASAELLARLYTRKDMNHEFDHFLNWALSSPVDSSNLFQIIGILLTISAIFEYAFRDRLLQIAEKCFTFAMKVLREESLLRNTLIRKLLMKLSQRIGLCTLKPKIAPWRYKRGNRILKRAAQDFKCETKVLDERKPEENEDEEDPDFPEYLEDIIEMLINGVKDKDTIVRWSASKGIGRITQRLPKEFADDVIESVSNLFAENTFLAADKSIDLSAVDENTWHGACLALAELARRGLLLPERLPQIMSWISKALTFDKKKATYSVGANVRDAACYVCWSFARAYDPIIMKPYVSVLAPHLITVAVFDREVNVRRAASAAFQENVGRQGIFPHGIDIITIADYFAVGNRNFSFTKTGKEVAKFNEYRFDLIEHLVKMKTSHWDSEIRIITSQALYELTKIEVDFIFDVCRKFILDACSSTDLFTRHGNVMALAEIIKAWTELGIEMKDLNEETIRRCLDIPITIYNDKMDFLSSFGSEIYVSSVSYLIHSLCLSPWTFNRNHGETYLKILEMALENQDLNVQTHAASALNAYEKKFGLQKEKVLQYFDNLDLRKDPIIRKGFTLTLKNLSKYCVQNLPLDEQLTTVLIEATVLKNEPQIRNDPECRQFACDCIAEFLIANQSGRIEFSIAKKMIHALINALEDYAVDARGDVGSWVRESAMKALDRVLNSLIGNSETWKHHENDEIWAIIVGKCLRQSMERIDKVREVAGRVLESLLNIETFKIPHKDDLKEIVLGEPKIHWNMTVEVFPRMVQILSLSQYRFQGLLGITSSIGSMNESITGPARKALVDFFENIQQRNDENSTKVDDIVKEILSSFSTYKKIDRVVVPIFDTIEQLMSLQMLDTLDVDNASLLLHAVRNELFKSKDVKKLMSGIKVIGGMLLFPNTEVFEKSKDYMLMYLVHPYPRIRKSAAEVFYLSLVSMPEPLKHQPEIEAILLETNWDNALAELKPIRDQLTTYF